MDYIMMEMDGTFYVYILPFHLSEMEMDSLTTIPAGKRLEKQMA